MSELDDFLSAIGISRVEPTNTNNPQPSAPPEPPVEETNNVVDTVSDEEMNDILRDLGIEETLSDNENEPTHTVDVPIDELEEDENSEDESEEEEEESSVVRIEENSPTFSMDIATSRFSGTEWFEKIREKRIIVAGIGGIGSNLVFQLARLGVAGLTIYDHDMVEEGNMSGQMFGESNIGQYKVTAISNIVARFNNVCPILSIPDFFTSSTTTGDIMMCGFDSMEARKAFFYAWQRHVRNTPTEHQKNCLYLDGRLSIDTLQIFCIRGDDSYNRNRYENEFLFKDEEADATVCSMKQTTYMACMIATMMANLFVNFVANSIDPAIPYALPFLTQYESQHMLFKTEN